MNPNLIQQQTASWLTSVIIPYKICPFAEAVVTQQRLKYYVNLDTSIETCLLNLISECQVLDSEANIETSLLIYPNHLTDFSEFLEYLTLAEELLYTQGYDGIYQLASFHPQYCFQDAEQDDPANYTNRSPYPMLHLLRESSIEAALQVFPNPENIPSNNIQLTRSLGLQKMQQLLAKCI